MRRSINQMREFLDKIADEEGAFTEGRRNDDVVNACICMYATDEMFYYGTPDVRAEMLEKWIRSEQEDGRMPHTDLDYVEEKVPTVSPYLENCWFSASDDVQIMGAFHGTKEQRAEAKNVPLDGSWYML